MLPVHSVAPLRSTKVMARNLMGLGGGLTAVAIIGIFHVDGIERILTNNGWQRRLS